VDSATQAAVVETLGNKLLLQNRRAGLTLLDPPAVDSIPHKAGLAKLCRMVDMSGLTLNSSLYGLGSTNIVTLLFGLFPGPGIALAISKSKGLSRKIYLAESGINGWVNLEVIGAEVFSWSFPSPVMRGPLSIGAISDIIWDMINQFPITAHISGSGLF
jgi:hypothetical protein